MANCSNKKLLAMQGSALDTLPVHDGWLFFLLRVLGRVCKSDWLKKMVVSVLAFVLVNPTAFGAETAVDQAKLHSVIAAMITKISTYTEWPAGGFVDDQKNATVAVLTRDPQTFKIFGDVINNKKHGGAKWKIKRVRNLTEAAQFHFVFFDHRYTGPGDKWYETVKDRGVLTFTGGEGNRAIFKFVLVNGKVNFDINLDLAKKANVEIDPRLLKLARQVISNQSEP